MTYTDQGNGQAAGDLHNGSDPAADIAQVVQQAQSCIDALVAASRQVESRRAALAKARDERTAAERRLVHLVQSIAHSPAATGAVSGMLRQAGVQLPPPSRR